MFSRLLRINFKRRVKKLRPVFITLLFIMTLMSFSLSTRLVIITVIPEEVVVINDHRDFDNVFTFKYPIEMNLQQKVDALIQNKSAIDMDIINPHPFRYINNPPPCEFESDKPTMLVLVKSAVKNFQFRFAIRSTWGKIPPSAQKYIRVVYMLGYSEHHQKMVDFEIEEFNDIVAENFIENYKNNTYKSIMGYTWAAKYCNKADFVLFVDDDIVTDVPGVYRYLSSLPEIRRQDLFAGLLVEKGLPERITASTWFVSLKEFPYTKYPHYLAGGAYVASMSVVNRFQLAFPYVKYFWVDDAYLGIVARKLRIKPTSDPKFEFQNKSLVLGNHLVSHRESHRIEDIVDVFNKNVERLTNFPF